MRELALNILDLADNSVKAGATLVEIIIEAKGDKLSIEVRDDGAGMSDKLLGVAADPYVTTRKERKVGMGLSLLKEAAEATGGRLEISSASGTGTSVQAIFGRDHIDRAPLGNVAEAAITLLRPDLDFILVYTVDGRTFTFDTREVKEILGGIAIDSPEIMTYIKSLLTENIESINGGIII